MNTGIAAVTWDSPKGRQVGTANLVNRGTGIFSVFIVIDPPVSL